MDKSSKFDIDIDIDILNNYKKNQLFNNLIIFIKNKNSKEALALLNNNKAFISFCQFILEGFTPLMFACMYQLEDVALAIINTGYSKPGHVSDNTFTALNYAIYNNLEKVAYALIIDPTSNLGHIDQFGNNALIHACKSENENIALFIIKNNNGAFRKLQQPSVSPMASHLKQAFLEAAEQCNLQQKNNFGKTALMYAVENKLDIVAFELNKIYYPPWIKVPL
jgi:ankyrin repeat protein